MSDVLAVTGAAGQLARRAVANLLDAGVAPSRLVAITRDPDFLAANKDALKTGTG